ncbi:MAG TPA: hypothetical protein VKC58_01450 [Myxococcales bacterium]|jgi:hypothetical protein|nr:hypothetical protein [Myxococcales bacterium]
MTSEERPPTEAEAREADLLAHALEDPARPGRDVAAVDDALGTAWLLRASKSAELSELRARAVLKRAWPGRPRWLNPTPGAMAALGAAAAVAAILSLLPRGPAKLPPPPVPLLRAQVAAARPGAQRALAPLEAEMDAHRERLYGALARAYGTRR